MSSPLPPKSKCGSLSSVSISLCEVIRENCSVSAYGDLLMRCNHFVKSSAINEPVVDVSVVSPIVDVDGSGVVVTKSKLRNLIYFHENKPFLVFRSNLPAFRVVTVVDSF